jgi:hypothetical protein
MKRMLLIAAILVLGAMMGGTITYLSLEGRPDVVETTSAQEAWGYAIAGWHCEAPTEEGILKPINVELLEIFAKAEQQAAAGDWYDSPARCTEPSSP